MDARLDETLFPTADYWRHGPRSPVRGQGFKEWSHFAVLAPGLDLLVNFSLTRSAATGTASPRLTLLIATADGVWDGDVELFGAADVGLAEARHDVSYGRNSAVYLAGRYRVRAELTARPVTVTLDLQPVARPVIANNVRLSEAESVRWLVVPRLLASGEVSACGRRFEIDRAPAYHDRNWGSFAWGGDYAWEWATILPEDVDIPWSLVYSRISDRLRSTTVSQSLIVWRREFPSRKFYGRDLSVAPVGLLRRERVLRIPRVVGLLLPGTANDVPERLEIAAGGFGDELAVGLALEDFAQVGIPNDSGLGLTTLCEIKGRAKVTGRIGGERIEFDGRVQAELNCAAR